MTKREDNLKAVVTRYIGILNSQNLLSLDKVAEIIVSMMTDLESAISNDLEVIRDEVSTMRTRVAGNEDELRNIEGDVLGQVVRYVIGESLAKPGGLPADIQRLVESSQKVERGIGNLSSELVHLIDRVDRLERTEKESGGKLYLRRAPIQFLIIAIGLAMVLIFMQ